MAAIKQNFVLDILAISDRECRYLCHYLLPKSLHTLITQLTTIKWAPTGSTATPAQVHNISTSQLPYLLLSDGIRLIVLNPNFLRLGLVGYSVPPALYVVADYQLGERYGKLTYADFLLGSLHVLATFELASHASILSVAHPRRDELAKTKFADDRGIAIAPNGKVAAFLLRSQGQDQLVILTRDGENVKLQTTFALATSDAQGLMWSPDGEPVIAVWDSAAYGPAVFFSSAFGHRLKQLDITHFPHADTEILVGVTCFSWIKHHVDTMLAVSGGHRRVLLRQQQHKTMVRTSHIPAGSTNTSLDNTSPHTAHPFSHHRRCQSHCVATSPRWFFSA